MDDPNSYYDWGVGLTGPNDWKRGAHPFLDDRKRTALPLFNISAPLAITA